jgi:hypothetical protein
MHSESYKICFPPNARPFTPSAATALLRQSKRRLVGQMAGEILTEADILECLLHALAASPSTPGIADARRSGD